MIIWENKYPIVHVFMAPKGYNLIGIPRSGKYLHIIWKVYIFDKIQITMKYNFVWADTNLAWYIYQNSIWTAKLDSKYDIIDEEEDDVFIKLF